MKRWLLRLYPKWWRERYGAELGAWLDDAEARPGDSWDLLKGALTMRLSDPLRTMAIALLGVGLCNAAIFAWHAITSPPVSYATLAGPVKPGDVFERAERAFSRPALVRVIEKHGLWSKNLPMEDTVEHVRRHARLGLSREGFQMGYADPDPARAQAVAAELAQELKAAVPGLELHRAATPGEPLQMPQIHITWATLAGLLGGVLIARLLRRRGAKGTS